VAALVIIVAVLVTGASEVFDTREQRQSIPFDPTNHVDFGFVAIPEPGALVSLIGGAAVLIGIQRFRRRG
jgi:hypothetical protein